MAILCCPCNCCHGEIVYSGHYQSRDKYQQLQSCLVNLDVSMLDLHGTVKMCMDHGLYDALIYLYNRGLQDYITPLEELLLQLRKVLRENEVLPGNNAPLPLLFQFSTRSSLPVRFLSYNGLQAAGLHQVRVCMWSCMYVRMC